ncbi:bifunctional 3-hydroxydecanoyl-ACP dehydratase/trans-2-decenoyl-ACP isomerase [Litoribacillus peritrichatus]|uniref:3-hydroxyacyl-[acyl-carrier-protein] dehydratase FabA n=1 Tax=Litoribacillus peritrichatus TaxID=718191 RepID=A0ABP7NDQ0_9GAMM
MLQASFSKEQLSASLPIMDDLKMQLPQGEMQLLDRVVSLSDQGGLYGRGEVVAEFDIHPDLWFFKCHFPGDPIMPGCLGIDALWQTMGVFLASKGHVGKCRALGVSDVKFCGEILPTVEKVRFHVHIKRIIKRGMTLALADGFVYADGEEIYSARNLKAALI